MKIPGSHVKILAADGKTEVPINTVGELVTQNPGLAKGYWKLPAVTASKFRDGWLYTGDLMRQDEDGFFYFVGRNDDMINISGENVYPKEIVEILLQNPNVHEAFVVPAPHSVKGFMPVAFVILANGCRVTERDLQEFFLRLGAPYAYPRKVFFLDKFPLSGTGKIDRAELIRIATERIMERNART